MPKTLTQTLDDPEFKKLSPPTQKAVIKKLGVSEDMQTKLILKLGHERAQASERQPDKQGAVGAFMSDIGGMISGVAKTTAASLPGVSLIPESIRKPVGILTPAEQGMEAAQQAPEDWRRRKAEGYSVPYRLLAPVAESAAGVNVSGMEEAAKKGDTGAVLGHAAAPIAAAVAADVGARGMRAIKPKADIAPIPEHLKPLTEEQRAKYVDDLRAANKKYVDDMVEYADKESQARAKWVEKAHNAKKSVTDRIAAQNKKQILETGAREHVRLAKDNIQQTHDAVRGSLDARWNDMRSQMSGTEISAPEDIYNGIREAETEHLRGAPQSLQQFRNLMRELGIEDFVENEDGSLSAAPDAKAKPLDWETGRVHYSAIGDKLASGGLPGNVYQALKSVHTLLDDKLGAAADAQGRGTQYRALKADWSEYMRDWKDTSAVSTGGSPLAKILQSPDQAYVQMQVAGKAGDRMLSTLAKYKRFGAKPELASRARSLLSEAKGVEIPKAKEMPAKYEKPTPPKRKEVPVPEPKPKGVKPLTKAIVRAGGHVGMGGLAQAFGVPWWYGSAVGGSLAEAGLAIAERRKARAGRLSVPESVIPPD